MNSIRTSRIFIKKQHANMKGLGLTPLFKDRHGFMPPQLKKQQQKLLLSLEGSFPGNNTSFFQDKKSHLQTRQTIYSWPLLSTFLAFLSDFGNGSWQDINRSGSFHQTTLSTYPPPARPSTYVSSVHVETISQLCSTLILSNCQISHINYKRKRFLKFVLTR